VVSRNPDRWLGTRIRGREESGFEGKGGMSVGGVSGDRRRGGERSRRHRVEGATGRAPKRLRGILSVFARSYGGGAGGLRGNLRGGIRFQALFSLQGKKDGGEERGESN